MLLIAGSKKARNEGMCRILFDPTLTKLSQCILDSPRWASKRRPVLGVTVGLARFAECWPATAAFVTSCGCMHALKADLFAVRHARRSKKC